MEKYAGPIVGVAIVALLGLGLYTMQVRSELGKAKTAAASATQQVSTLQKQVADAATKVAASGNDLQTCQGQLKTAQEQLAATAPKRAARP